MATKRKLIYLAIIALTLLTAPISRADTIKLKDGRTIRCDGSREDGQLIRYWIGDNFLTVARDKVEKIEKDTNRGEQLGANNGISSGEATVSSKTLDLPKPRLGLEGNNASIAVTSDTLRKLEENFKADPNNRAEKQALIDALRSSAYLEYQGGNLSAAKSLFKKIIDLDNKMVDAYMGLSYIGLSEGRYSETVDAAQHALALDSKNQSAAYALGYAYYALDKTAEAIKVWQEALKSGPNSQISAVLAKAEKDLVVANDSTNGRTRFFNISMEGGSTNTALESALIALLEDNYSQLKKRFDFQPSEKISVIFYTKDTFRNITQAPSWVGALNDGKLRIPIGGLNGVSDPLSHTVMHELTHSFVFFKSHGKCPHWLNEGVAQLMEGRSAMGERAQFSRVALPTMQTLSGSFMGFSTEQAQIAYLYSLFATEVLAERGVATVIKIMEDLGQNYNINAALARNTRFQNMAAFEQELKRRISE